MMKNILKITYLITLFSFVVTNILSGQNLAKSNETLVCSFVTKENKIISLSKENSNKYLVFRVGTKDSIEWQFPKKLDSTSWKLFQYEYGGFYDRNFISFCYKEHCYSIYEYYKGNKLKEIGLETNTSLPVKFIAEGIKNSQQGSLKSLIDNDLINKLEMNIWLEERHIVHNKSYFYSDKNEASKTKKYIVKGDTITISAIEGDWVYALYVGKTKIEGWIKTETLNSINSYNLKP